MQNYQIKCPLNKYKIINYNNPYKENTKEFFMVKFTLESLEYITNHKIEFYDSSKCLSFLLDRYYQELSVSENIDLDLISYDYNKIIEWGFWLCLNHNLIVETHLYNPNEQIMGIYFDTPFIDTINDNIDTLCNELYNISDKPLRIISYLYNNIITKKIKNHYHIPNVSKTTYSKKFSDTDFKQEINNKWINQDFNIDNLDRNIIHHTSDHYSLFWAMKNILPNSTYILSPGILNNIEGYYYDKEKEKSQIRTFGLHDFYYIYGLTSLTNFQGTHNSHYYSSLSQNNNSIIMFENDENYEKHWLINSFTKKAKRDFTLYTTKELEEKIKNDFLEYIPETKDDFLKELTILENEINQEIDKYFTDKNYMINSKIFINKANLLCHKYFKNFPIKKYFKEKQFFYKSVTSKFFCGVFNTEKNTSFDNKENIDNQLLKEVNYIDYLISFIETFFFYCFTSKNKLLHLSFKNYFLKRINIYWNSPDSYKECIYESTQKNFIVSEIVNIKYEYRIFIINGKPICSTPCYRNGTPYDMWQSGKFDPRLSITHNSSIEYNQKTRDLVAKYIKFAKKLALEIKQENKNIKHYVLDLGYDDINDEIIPIEINSINFSGLYMLNTHLLINAINKNNPNTTTSFNKNDDFLSIQSFNTIREDSWKEAKEKALILYGEGNEYYSNKIKNAKLIINKK